MATGVRLARITKMLEYNTLFEHVNKVENAIKLIRENEPDDGYVVAFSGGKDSCVVLDLTKRAGVKYEARFSVTSVDPPELLDFIKEHHPEVVWRYPKESMFELIVRFRIMPTRVSRFCTSRLKERFGKNETTILGIRRSESRTRANRPTVEYRQSRKLVHPIGDWSYDDVWEYIHSQKLPYCSLYDEGFHRIGCVMCACQSPHVRRREAARWPEIAQKYREAANEAIARGQKSGIPHVAKTGDELYELWLSDRLFASRHPKLF